MYSRLLSIDTIPAYQSFFLFGPRGTGKSTLVKKYLASCNHPTLIYDLLKTDDYLRVHANPAVLRYDVEAHLSQSNNPEGKILQILIDEVQKTPSLLDEVHFLLETYPKKLRFILSGSSARKLKRGGANLLAGRAWQRALHPLSPLEIGPSFQLTNALQYGTLPAIVPLPSQEKIEQLRAYVTTYLQEEIQAEAATRRLEAFHRFLEAAAQGNGELVNMANIAREAAIPRSTVISYYQILEDTMVGFFLPSWGRHLSRKDLVTHGKFYFFDNGIVSTLTQNLSLTLTDKNPLFGKLFEHFCLLEFIRIHTYQGTEHRIGFFRTRAGAEVDLVEEKHGKIRAIEIKSSASVARSQLRGLVSFGEEFPHAEKICLCRTLHPYRLGEIQCLPWQTFFAKEGPSTKSS